MDGAVARRGGALDAVTGIAMTRFTAALIALVPSAIAASACVAGADGDRPLEERHAEPVRDLGGRWFSLGILGGSTRPDPKLANYQWDAGPRAAWGSQALAGMARFAAGLRVWRAETRQKIDVPDAPTSTTVRMTSLELVGRGPLATALGTRVSAVGSVGRLHLGYHPDRVTVQPSGSGSPIVVDLAPVDEWIAGGGVALQRPLSGPWTASLEVDHRVFGLDTAHRNGDVIEYRRESFRDWSARLELAWLYLRP